MSDIIRPQSRANDLIRKFKSREQQTGIQQALVFLKLKEKNCPTKSALIFSKKKQKNVDGTLEKDGPADYRRLKPFKPDGIMVNGWVKGEKLKYQDATSFNHFLRQSSASLASKISQFNKQSRLAQEYERKNRSQSLFSINLQKNPKESLLKILAVKDNVMKQREISPFVFKVKGLELAQMTKIFSQQISGNNSNGLVIKTGAFQNCINNPNVQYVSTDENLFGKSTNNVRDTFDMTILDKRNQILNFKKLLQQNEGKEQVNKMRCESSKKMAKTLNLNRSFKNINKSSKIIRSKSAMKQNQTKQFEDKISLVIRKQFYNTFSNFKRNIQLLNEPIKKLKLSV